MVVEETNLLENHRFSIESEGSVVAVRRAAKELACDAGFDEVAAWEIAIAVSELASNIVNHAGRGQIGLGVVRRDGVMGIAVESSDQGPGIADSQAALTDGFSTGSGLGYGLGAVNRLMDQFDILSPEEASSGARIQCVRWNHRISNERAVNLLDVGIVSRSKPGEQVNGDACLLIACGQTRVVGVIDGVGHGPLAHQASTALRHFVESHAWEPLNRIMTGAAHVCRATRGAVMSLARIDCEAGILEHAGIGNIETRLLSDMAGKTLLTSRGILGVGVPEARVTREPWHPGDILAMFSDGLRTSWNQEQFPSARLLPAQQLARELFDELVRDDDDATIVVVKYPEADELGSKA